MIRRRVLRRDSRGLAGVTILIVVAAVAVILIAAVVVVRSGSGDDEATDSLETEQSVEPETGPDGAADDADTDSQQNDSGSNSNGCDAGEFSFGDTEAGLVIKELAPDYGADGAAAVNCIEQNIVGGLTAEERAIILANPNVSTWPPGLGEKFAAVLEECIPLEPFYLTQFGSFPFSDPNCVRAMTDYVLSAYSWAVFIVKGIMDEGLYPALQAEFDAYVNAGYQATECYAA